MVNKYYQKIKKAREAYQNLSEEEKRKKAKKGSRYI